MRDGHTLRASLSLLMAALLLTPAAEAASGVTSRPSPAEARLREHLRFLASDDLKGRATGEPGCDEAARYIESQFRDMGLNPPPGWSGFRQEYTATLGSLLGENNEFRVPSPSGPGAALKIKEDYNPFGFSGSGRAEAPVVFAGYGISAPEFNYDDYAGLDVKGKIVLVLRHEPQQADSLSIFNGNRATRFSEFRTKARIAEEHGAAGLIVVTDPLSREAADDDLISFGKGQGISASVALPAVHLKRRALDRFWGVGTPPLRRLEDVQREIDASLKPQSFAVTGGAVSLAVDIRRERKTTANVVGWLPPSGISASALFDSLNTPEYVVLGAHYDHLGLGGENSLSPDTLAIHNGADDNASGTAALIEAARALNGDPGPRRRGVFFVAFSGEELGLLGSSWFVAHPPLRLGQDQAMLNMDMVGRLKGGKLQVGGVGTSPRFKPLIEQLTAGTELHPDYSEGGFGPSDHSSFYARQRPVLFFFTGLHEDYHRPSDDWPKINFDGLAQVAQLVTRLTTELIQKDDPVPFQLAAADSSRPISEGAGGGYGAYLGTIPDFGENPNGVKITGVSPGSPAQAAGLAADDIIVSFAGHTVRNLYDLTDELRAHHAGDTVEIGILRGGNRQTVVATLRKRK